MELNFMTPEKEQEVFDAVKEAISKANDGMDPNDAIAKSASAHGFTPDIAKRMVEAFNSSKTMFLFGQKDFDKTAEFAIADASEVIRKMYPDTATEKKAYAGLPHDYKLPEEEDYTKKPKPLAKAAAAVVTRKDLPSYEFIVKQAYDRHYADQRGIDAAKTEAATMKERLRQKFVKLSHYFTETPKRERKSFAEVERSAIVLYGDMAKRAMDIVWAMTQGRLVNEKRAEACTQEFMVDKTADPLPEIKSALDLTMKYAKQGQIVEKMTDEASKFWKSCQDRFELIKKSSDEEDESKPGFFSEQGKEAIKQFGAPGKKTEKADPTPLLSIGEARFLPPKKPYEPTPETQPFEMLRTIDPEFESQARSIHSTTMLADMMANDPVISEANSEDVLKAYNELARLAPRASKEPMIVRNVLRKVLQQGNLDIYDSSTLAELEQRLAKILESRPEGLLT